mmetsp:Transcript_85810/g.151434  ORF Transcript_85810/g.151434 Transcript_85810/m.151434 type:complete len:350 (+) Transcript_85810:220-1269(+)
MGIDIELLLEAASDNAASMECFAAVRAVGDASSGPSSPLTRCVPHKASRISGLASGDNAVIDIYQRVGSISVGFDKLGEFTTAPVMWPGHSDFKMRVTAAPPPSSATKAEPSRKAAPVDSTPVSKPFAAVQVAEAAIIENVSAAGNLQEPPEVSSSESSSSIEATQVEDDSKLRDCHELLPRLYLGGKEAANNHQGLRKSGINAVVCCQRELEYPERNFCPDLEYYRVDVEDISREPIELFFHEATEFIHENLERKNGVLVHCKAGVSRSPSVVIAYLVKYHDYTLYDAFAAARRLRSCVTPNLGFMLKLCEWEVEIRGGCTTVDYYKYENWFSTPGCERPNVPELRPE